MVGNFMNQTQIMTNKNNDSYRNQPQFKTNQSLNKDITPDVPTFNSNAMDNEGFIYEHYYISDEIFANVVKKISDIAATIVGANNIVLYAVTSSLGFYERNGFSNFLEYMEPDHTAYLDGCIPMYLDI